MAEALEADWNQVHILPAQIEDWIGVDHSARYIRTFVDELDLEELGFPRYHGGGRGRPPYSTALLLRAWLYGYLQKTRSSRSLEHACKERMGFIWLCGTHTPDHNSLWRFWRTYRKQIKQVFLETVKIAAQLNMIGFVTEALDGTKIQAACSSRGGHGKSGLENMLAKVNQSIEELESEVQQSQAGLFPEDASLPQALANAKALRDKIKDAQATIKANEAKYVQPREPDARRMNTHHGKGNTFAYNAQAMVDAKHQIITAAEVVNDNNDADQLDSMIDRSEINTGCSTETTLADGGYSNANQLQKLQEKERDVVMPLPSLSKNTKNNPYHKSCFSYEPDTNTVTCPQGQELTQVSNKHKEELGTKTYRNYAACKVCPARNECTNGKRGRAIEIRPHHENVEVHRAKMQLERSKELYKERAGIVEPIFAWIKIMDQFNRWTFKGLENVQAQWQWICTAQNLKRIMQVWQKEAKAS